MSFRLYQFEVIIRTIMSYEMRMRASEQSRGENLALDQSSVYYDGGHLFQWKSHFVAQTVYEVHRPVRCTGKGSPGMLLSSALYQIF